MLHPHTSAQTSQMLSGLGLRCWYGEPSIMTVAHRHDDIEINFITQGAMTYWFGGGRVTLAPHHCAVFWGAMPHQLVAIDPATRFFWLTIPLDWFFRWRLPTALTDTVLQGAFLCDAESSAWEESLFARWLDDQALPHHQEVMRLELEARLARFALSMHTADGGMVNTTAEHIAQVIATRYQEAIGVNEIAHTLHLHPNYAMRIFQQAFGRTINETLTQYRLAHAQRLLVTTQASVLEIALEAGFGSLSRFYAVFKARCGQSPKQYREKF
jgi:AraC family transcriptional regulator, melibiose operon regulatory protein